MTDPGNPIGGSGLRYTRALIPVQAGEVYFIELMEGVQGIPNPTDLSVTVALRTDLSVDEIRVRPQISPTDSTRIVEVDLAGSPGFGPRTTYTLEACSLGGPEAACVTVAKGSTPRARWWPTWTAEISWETAGCVGDVELRATVWSPYVVELDGSNNQVRTIVPLAGAPIGAGSGVCAF